MDGTLLNTETLARACFLRACDELGWQADVAVYDRCIGTTWEETERIMRRGFGDEFPYEKIEACWSAHYNVHVLHQPVAIMPGIEAVLSRLADLGVPMAVASASRRGVVERKLQLAGLDKHFEILVCSGETPRGKPYADPYLLALEHLDVVAGDCWAIEDSDNGVRAAVAAGMLVFQIPDQTIASDEVAAFGHRVLPSAVDLLHLLPSVTHFSK